MVMYRKAAALVFGAVALVALGGSLAAIESGGPAPRPVPSVLYPTASQLCRAALGSKMLNAKLTTVGAVRALRIGPDAAPAPHAFAPTPGSQVAAWCWTGKPGTYRLYAVTGSHSAVHVEGVTWSSTPRPGPAPIP
jgi:hypothetical protein